jgi:hypothetical protein
MMAQEKFRYIWPALKYLEVANNQNNIRVKQGVLDAF